MAYGQRRVCPRCGGWAYDLSADDERRIGDAVQAWMAEHMEDER